MTRRRWRVVVVVLLLVAAAGIANLRTRTRQGVNFVVTAHEIPAYVKTIDFLQRHYQYELLTERICGRAAAVGDCVLALFDWTYENIRPTPSGLPVIDDHPSHIAIRGYGEPDQLADLFSILAAYAGAPAFFRRIVDPEDGTALDLAFAHLEGRWIPFDVAQHVVFRRGDGRLASIDELLADPRLLSAAPVALPAGKPYSAYISRDRIQPFEVPSPTRGELQQPWRRLRHEVLSLVQ